MELCLNSNMERKSENDCECYVLLKKDGKSICRTKCYKPQNVMPAVCEIIDFVKACDIPFGLPKYHIYPAYEDKRQKYEWGQFLGFLQKAKRAAKARMSKCQLYIFPPQEDKQFSHAIVSYKMVDMHTVCESQKQCRSEIKDGDKEPGYVFPLKDTHFHGRLMHCTGESILRNPNIVEEESSSICKSGETFRDSQRTFLSEKHYADVNPNLLYTFGEAHSNWIFGGVAELVDNARDAKATTLKISINMIYSSIDGKEIPMLSVIDDGTGMTYQEILRMVTLGHKQPNSDDPQRIGRFGVGFKTGAMSLGKDALVLTQSKNSRSIAFLSQSLNEGKDKLEIPLVSYHRRAQFMEIDTSLQTLAATKHSLKAIMEFSPFNEYLIGEKAGLFSKDGTGTQIYIWNLDKWGSDYLLEWTGTSGASSFHQGDILLRPRGVRTRPGQMTQEVHLDFSLRSYLEVIFLDPRMKIYVQGSPVKSRPLAKCLHNTVVEIESILGKPVQLTLGRSQLEWDRGNCGIFLYWHGRLIEAYKRVGGMLHNGERSHGIIGVIDITDLMNDGNGRVWVLSNKQGFKESQSYARLLEWLGRKVDEYLDNHFDKFQLEEVSSLCNPDHEWVQCNKCRKWRMLSSGFESKTLPQEWFCYMKPYNGKCTTPEDKVEPGVVTVSTKRSGYQFEENQIEQREKILDKPECRSQVGKVRKSSGANVVKDEKTKPSGNMETGANTGPLKRLRKGLPRASKDN